MSSETASSDTASSDAANLESENLSVEIEEVGPCSKKLSITVPAERVDHEIEQTMKNVSRTVQFPGFRAGKAPRKMVEARVGPQVLADVKQRMVEQAIDDAVRQAELKPVGGGKLDFETIEFERGADLKFDVTLDVRPEFDIPDLSEVSVTRPALSVTDDHIAEQVEQIRLESAQVQDKSDGPIAEHGMADLTVDLTVEEDTILEDAETQWSHPSDLLGGMLITGFAEELMGKSKGDVVSFTQPLPDQFRDPELRGKDADIKVTVGDVRNVTLPDVDDKFAQDMDYDDLEEMRDEIRKQLERRLADAEEEALDEAVVNAVLEAIPFEVPPSLQEAETTRMLRRYAARLNQEGIPEEQIGAHLQQAQTEASTKVVHDLRASFILDKIATERKVFVTESEVHQELTTMAARYNRTPDEMEAYMERQELMTSLRSTLRERKTVRELRDVLTIVDAAPADDAGGEETA